MLTGLIIGGQLFLQILIPEEGQYYPNPYYLFVCVCWSLFKPVLIKASGSTSSLILLSAANFNLWHKDLHNHLQVKKHLFFFYSHHLRFNLSFCVTQTFAEHQSSGSSRAVWQMLSAPSLFGLCNILANSLFLKIVYVFKQLWESSMNAKWKRKKKK